MKLSDDDMKKALLSAGVPQTYCRPDATLDSVPLGPKIKGLLTAPETLGKRLINGAVLEICGVSHQTTEAYYLTVRALVQRGVAIRTFYAEELKPNTWTSEFEDYVNQYRVLAIEGMTPVGGDPFGKDRFSVEWRLRRWLESGRGLVVLTDVQIKGFELWSNRFRSLLETRLVKF